MKKNRILAGLLAFITGTFGLHRFYLNDIMGGIFYLFLFFLVTKIAFPITTILGIIEGIRFFNMSDKEFDKRYNRGMVQNTTAKTKHKNIRTTTKRKRKKSFFPKRNPFKKSALEKFENYDFKGAIEDYRKALDISPDDPELHYQIAKAYSLNEEKKLAFRHLDTAVRLGLKNPGKIDKDEDLAFIRIQPVYESFKANGYVLEGKAALDPPKDDLLNEDLLLAQLKKLNELRKKGVLTQEEFEIEKRKLKHFKS